MTKIKSFNRANLEDVRKALQVKLDEIQKELGVAISVGNMRFNDETFTAKMTAAVAGDTKRGVDVVAKTLWNKHCMFHDMKKSDFGKKTIINGEEFKITGIKPRSRNSITCTRTRDNKGYKISSSMVKAGMTK